MLFKLQLSKQSHFKMGPKNYGEWLVDMLFTMPLCGMQFSLWGIQCTSVINHLHILFVKNCLSPNFWAGTESKEKSVIPQI